MPRLLPDPNRPLQRRIWLVERTGWLLLALMVCWAALGGAGNGVLATERVIAGNFELSYDRFTRRGLQTPFDLRWTGGAASLVVGLDARFVDEIGMVFDPSQVVRRRGEMVLLTVDTDGSAGTLHLAAHPTKSGTIASRITVDGQSFATVSVFVFP